MSTTTQPETIVEYHRDTSALTNSAKEKFFQSPALYHGQYVTRTIPFAPSTPAQLLGSLAHTILLEPERFDLEYTVAPASCRARSGKTWKATLDEAEDRGTTPVLESHVVTACRMANAVKAHETAWKLLSSPHGVAEETIRWTDPLTQIRPGPLREPPRITDTIGKRRGIAMGSKPRSARRADGYSLL